MTFSDDLEAVRIRAGLRRFRIKRLALDVSAEWPWQVKDRERPHVFGHARTHRAAVLLVDAIRSGNNTVLNDDDEVIAYRPGPADLVFTDADPRPFLANLRALLEQAAMVYPGEGRAVMCRCTVVPLIDEVP